MNYSDLSTEQQMIAETKKYVNNKALDVQSDWNESDSSAGDYIKNKPTLGTAAVLDVASSGDASSSQVVKGDDSRLTDSRDAADVYSWAKAPTKPTYTASEVGAYTKTESDNKYVAKETGKGLSTNDFTAEYINAINDNTDNISDNTIAIQTNATNITALQNNKVDKVVGKGLSTNDFTNNFKKGIAISQELAYDRATIPQPNLDADFHTVNGERTVIYQGNAYSFNTMTYNPITKKYVYGIRCTPVYQGGLFFCEVDNPASDRHNWLDQTTFPTDILINGDIYTAVMPTGEAYYVAYSYNNNDEKELVYSDALDSSRFDYWVKTEIIIDSIFNIGNYVFYVADNKVYKYEFAHGSVELDFDTVPFAYTYGGGRCIALTKNQYNVISAFMSYDGIEWTKVNFPSINKTNKPSGLIYDHGIFLFYQEDDEYVITSKDGFSWEKHKLSIDMTEFRENFMIFDEIGWGGGIFYACVNSVDEGHYDDYTIWTSQDGYTWEQTVKYLEDEIDNKTDYYNGTYLISVAQNLYYPTYRLDGVYGKDDVYTKSESDNKYVTKETGKGLSTNDYTTADKSKLAGIEAEANKTVVDSSMSDSSTNPLQNKVITKELEGAKTTTGNPITVTDAAPVNAVNLSVDLEPIQDLHGYDHPWVGGAGKNKVNPTANPFGISARTGATNYEPTSHAYIAKGLAGETVTVSRSNHTSSGYFWYGAYAETALESGLTPLDYGDMGDNLSATISVPVGTGMLVIFTGADEPTNLQAEIGSTATSFAPYSNICHISGRSEVTIDRVGKNLFDELYPNIGSTIQYKAIYVGDGEFTLETTTPRLEVACALFLLAGNVNTGAGNDTNGVYDEQSRTVTALNGYVTIAYRVYGNINPVNYETILYKMTDRQTYTIQIGQEVYGGHLDITRGKMVVDKIKQNITNAMVFSKRNTTDSNKYRWAFVPNPAIRLSGIYDIDVISNALAGVVPYGTYGQLETRKEYSISGDTNDNFINIYLTGSGDQQELTDFLNNNDVYCVYELATPFTIDLTPQQIKMLENTNTISSDGTITLEYQPDNAIGEAVRAVEENYETRVSLLESRNTAKVYGFHISSTESDPAAKVTYLADAVGMTPAKMNYSKGKFDYGSWEDVWFVRDTKPCLLKDKGQIHCYLNKNNFLKDIDSNDTGVPQITIHTMIEFPKIWYKVVPDIDGKGVSAYIAPIKIDEDYVDYPYIDYLGNHKEHFYMPAYNGSTQTESGTTYLCSTYGETVSKSLTAEQEIAYCKAHGNGWNTEDAGSIMLINFLLILMGKSTDVQSVFGQGLHTSGTEAINNGFTTGIHYNKGMFYGTNSGTIASNSYSNAVKVFGIENYWGFQWRRYAGDILVDGVRKIKLCYGNEDGSSTFDYNLTGNGYVNVGATPSGTSGGYISEMKFTNTGMYSKVSSGSSSTHYCDGQWFNNSGTRYAFRAGASYTGALVGAFCVDLCDAASRAWWDAGAAPSYR